MLSGVDGELGELVSVPGVAGWLEAGGRPPRPRDTALYIDREDLAQTGWGIVCLEDEDPRVLKALRPLLELRRGQAGDLFREVRYSGENVEQFFRYQRLSPGPADPERLPYYLTLVGGPERIPFELETALGVQRAVGRIALEDPSAYRRYALGVLENEGKSLPEARQVSIFAVQNEDDPLTATSISNLAIPLVELLVEESTWTVNQFLGEAADKAQLRRTLDPASGALVFTASHAVRFSPDHSRQRSEQGGLVTADWPGPKAWRRPLPSDFLWTGADLDPGADYSGLVAFFFGCYTAGTPRRSEYQAQGPSNPILASQPFVSSLASRLLSHSGGGALAVVGHLDQTFEGAFSWPGSASRVETFGSVLVSLTEGGRLGAGLEVFARRYLEISNLITEALRESQTSGSDSRNDLAALWQAYFDARGFLIVGDPAVRLTSVASKVLGEDAA